MRLSVKPRVYSEKIDGFVTRFWYVAWVAGDEMLQLRVFDSWASAIQAATYHRRADR